MYITTNNGKSLVRDGKQRKCNHIMRTNRHRNYDVFEWYYLQRQYGKRNIKTFTQNILRPSVIIALYYTL